MEENLREDKAEPESGSDPRVIFNHYNQSRPMAWGQEKPPDFITGEDSTESDGSIGSENDATARNQKRTNGSDGNHLKTEDKTEEIILAERWDLWKQRPWG